MARIPGEAAPPPLPSDPEANRRPPKENLRGGEGLDRLLDLAIGHPAAPETADPNGAHPDESAREAAQS